MEHLVLDWNIFSSSYSTHQSLQVFASSSLARYPLCNSSRLYKNAKKNRKTFLYYIKNEELALSTRFPLVRHRWTSSVERSRNERCRDGERRWWRRRRGEGEEGGNEIALIVWNLILIPDVIWADAAVLKRRGNKRRFRKAPKGSTRATSTWHARCVASTLALCQSVKRLSRHFISRLPSPQFVHSPPFRNVPW